MAGLSDNDILKQSESAYKQWAVQWRAQAIANSVYPMKSMDELKYTGIGRAVLAVANGYSFERNIETIKKYQHLVDIICVDKCLIHLLRNGITPKYVLVCDANVSYEAYLEPVRDQLANTTLIMNVCGNPKWAANGNWKDRYFFVNKDVLKSELEFQDLSKCPNAIAAATNVSNAQIVILTQCDNTTHHNFFGYDKILMIGYDYCWDESYYAFDKTGGGKTHYMRGCHVYNLAYEYCYTSTNLLFSAKWLTKYIQVFKLPVIQCDPNSLVTGIKLCPDLAEQMQYSYLPEHSTEVISLLDYKRRLKDQLQKLDGRIGEISRDHARQLIRTT